MGYEPPSWVYGLVGGMHSGYGIERFYRRAYSLVPRMAIILYIQSLLGPVNNSKNMDNATLGTFSLEPTHLWFVATSYVGCFSNIAMPQ